MKAVVHIARWNLLPHVLLPLLISWLSVVSGISYNAYINSTLSHVCPYSSFCNHGPALKLQSKTRTSCCMPCSCEKDCYTRGTCCPDFNPRQAVEPSVKCKAAVFTNSTSTLILDGIEVSYYHIVDACPLGYKNQEVLNKCINPRFSSLQDVKDVAVVSNAEGIYYNRHCAHCNNEATFTMWTPILHDWDLYPTASEQGLVPAEYVLTFNPLNVEQATLSKCYKHYISMCDDTGVWNNHLTKACNEVNLYYTTERRGKVIVYKNPFCYLCNSIQGTVLSLSYTCEMVKDGTGAKSPGAGGTPMTMMLETNEVDNSIRTPINTLKQATSCTLQDRIYDKNFDVCRQLHCPVFSVPINGECLSRYVDINALSIIVTFELTTDNTLDLGETDLDTKERIHENAMNAIGLVAQGCIDCLGMWDVRKKGNSSVLFLFVNHQTTISCTLQTIQNTYRQISMKPIRFTLQIEGNSIVIIGKLNYEISPTEYSEIKETASASASFDKFVNIYAEKKCWSVLVLQDRFCEYIEISIQEYNTLKNRSYPLIQSNKFRFVNNEDNDLSMYRVCTDDYFWKQTNNGAGTPLLSVLAFIVSSMSYI